MSENEHLDEVVQEFLVESYENLDQLDRDLVELEKDPTSSDRLASVFRTIHTIKGTCGFLAFEKLEGVAHVGENLLTRLRDGRLVLNADITSGLLAMVDAIRTMLAIIEDTAGDGDNDYPELIARLTALQGDEKEGAATTTPETTGHAPEGRTDSDRSVEAAQNESSEDEALDAATVAAMEAGFAEEPTTDDSADVPSGDATSVAPPAESSPPAPPVVEPADDQPRTPGTTMSTTSTPETVVEAAPAIEQPPEPGSSARGSGPSDDADGPAAETNSAETNAPPQSSLSDTTIRVDVGLLDKLMNLVGELVLARNQILQFNATQEDTAFVATSQRLNLITTELQEGVMKTRMQPIGNIWNKFPRVVRDVAIACGKQADVEMEGRETELDKTIIEAIKDPLTHAVRNAVDHGIESPEVREAAGKPPAGRLFMRAFHEGGQVNIEISDDGAGIDPEKIKRNALEKGILSNEQLSRLADREVLNLIFSPGFSTAEKVTNVSGRGVGMDVVKTNIEKIGGTVDIQSRIGHGTTLRIKIPLTLAIIPALIVTANQERYAIPQVSLLELVRLEADQATKAVETIHGTPVYRLRGNLLPLVDLRSTLGMDAARDQDPSFESDGASKEGTAETAPAERPAVNIVVLQADDRQFGLVVEGINDTEEIVVKPLGKQLKGITSFAGATIMGDGRVALILDVVGLAQKASVVSEVRDRALTEAHDHASENQKETQTLLLFGMGETGRMAIPLSMVDRLEEFTAASVEHSANQEVVQYRGRILPLVRLSHQLGVAADRSGDEVLQVVVFSDEERSVGLVVDRILDIVEDALEIRRDVKHEGLLGSAVIQGRVTDLVDVRSVIRQAISGCRDAAEAA